VVKAGARDPHSHFGFGETPENSPESRPQKENDKLIVILPSERRLRGKASIKKLVENHSQI